MIPPWVTLRGNDSTYPWMSLLLSISIVPGTLNMAPGNPSMLLSYRESTKNKLGSDAEFLDLGYVYEGFRCELRRFQAVMDSVVFQGNA